MNRESITFPDEQSWLEARKHDLTSSDIPCLFGVGYQTYEELWQHKKNATSPEFTPDERILWGNALQDSIAHEFARRNKWTIRKKTEYIRMSELRLGSSFDFEIADYPSKLFEIKTVDGLIYKREWITDAFEIEATPYIELQFQHQLLVSGLKSGYIGALVAGNKGVVLYREVNENIHKAILKKSAEFWRSIDADK